MKKSSVLPGLVAIVLAVGAVFASESTVDVAGHKFSMSTPCEYVQDCNNIPNAPACESEEGDPLYRLGTTQCIQGLTHQP